MPNTEQSIEETGGIPVIEFEVDVFGMTKYPTDKTLRIPDMPADAKEVGDQLADIEAELANITGDAYPVGSIYITTSPNPPAFKGVWEEIAITATWSQLLSGKRGFEPLETGDTGGDVHFWHRKL